MEVAIAMDVGGGFVGLEQISVNLDYAEGSSTQFYGKR